MNKSELRSPAPSRGYRDFPTLGKHSSHSEPNMVPRTGLMAPSVHNTVFHPAANSNATYPLFCGRYTNDWQKDSERRDFTINAIYLDIDGNIFDPQSGTTDLKNNNIKFIGDPQKRIEWERKK